MLDRPAPPEQRARARRRQRRYRERQKAGRIAVTIDVDSKIVTWLECTRWLRKADFHTRREIAQALAGLIADSAQQS
jgi:hypothetical protein